MALELRGVRRPPVLYGIDLTVADGEVVGLRGANGAGKSTLLAIIAGIRRAEGTVRTGRVGWMGEPGPLARTVDQLLDLLALAHGRPDAVERVRTRIPLASGPIETLSAGQRRLVLLAAALISDPAVLLLDEPLTHLDDAGADVVRQVISDARHRGAAVLVATHRAHDLPLDRVVTLADGRLQ